MAQVKLSCPKCLARYQVDEALLGKKRRCKKCAATFVLTETEVNSSPASSVRLAAEASQSRSGRKVGEDGVPVIWRKGDVILDLYEVKGVLGEGGMGTVYRVHHRGWDTDLAVKSPKAELLAEAEAAENFEREAETWVKLGLHPHIVSCYYVRRLGGIPRVFVEYVEGSSLQDWIRSTKLYAGGPDKALERILDTAIQFAWGLQYAHEEGLIHQDVKPANVMRTKNGAVKVTDFGLANARAVAGERGERPAECSLLVSYGGMTPAYCSPEQARREKVSFRTDLWSWAVSMLEMFTGDVTWPSGSVADETLEAYLELGSGDNRLPRMPQELGTLLRRCFRREPEKRPKGMREIAVGLEGIHEHTLQRAYQRVETGAVRVRADVLNNWAVSLEDLDKLAEAENLWERALRVDPLHPEATYNLGLVRWHSGQRDDLALLTQLEAVRDANPKDRLSRSLLAQVHFERGDCASAIKELVEGIGEQSAGCEEEEALLRRARESLPHSRRCRLTFGPTGNAVSLSGDGRLALSNSDDGKTVKLWETASGRCLRTLAGHRGEVMAVSLSGDGRLALSGSKDKTVKLWETASGHCLHAFHVHTEGATSVSLSGDGRLALSRSHDNTAELWETANGRWLYTFQVYPGGVTAVSLSADGRLAVSGSDDKTVKLWKTSSGRCLRTLTGHTGGVTAVSLSADGRLALAGSHDATARLWETASGRCLRTLAGHAEGVTSVSLSGDGRLALSGSTDKTVKLWETASGRCLCTFQEHTSPVRAVSLSGDGRLTLSSGERTVRVWETFWKDAEPARLHLSRLQTMQDLQQAQAAHGSALEQARGALDRGDAAQAARYVRLAREQRGYERSQEALTLWRNLSARLPLKGLRTTWLLHTFHGHTGTVTDVSLSSDGRRVLSGSDDKTVRLWETSSGRCLQTFQVYTGGVTAVSLSADGRLALSGSHDNTAELWETASGHCLHSLWDGGYAVSLSGDGRLALSGGHANTAKLWDTTTGCILRTLEGHTDRVLAVRLSGDGRLALSASGDNTVKLWETSSGRCLRTLTGHTGWKSWVGLSSDGRLALSRSTDKTAELWETTSGKCLRTLELSESGGRTNEVLALSLSGDGRLALSGGADRTVKLWEMASGRCLRTLEEHKGLVWAVSLSNDGCLALSGSADKTTKLWFLDWELEA